MIYERYLFNKRDQETGENIDTYANSLRNLAKKCEYQALHDELIRDRIVCGIRENNIRKTLLQMPNLTLSKCIDTVRAAEVTSQQLKTMTADTVHAFRDPPSKPKSYTHRPQPSARKTKIINCKYCGQRNEWQKEKCPAYGQRCKLCNKDNHFHIKCPEKKQREITQAYQAQKCKDSR